MPFAPIAVNFLRLSKIVKLIIKLLFMTENELLQKVIDAAIRVHKALGPGLLENAYESCLLFELKKNNLHIEKQKPMPLLYNGVYLDIGYRVDLIVENRLIIEVKSVETLCDLHLVQLQTYLKLCNCKLGLLINFNVIRLLEGIRKVDCFKGVEVIR